ncbi:MAG: FAD-dependent oxidoreductase [Pseudomonadota bacterium]
MSSRHIAVIGGGVVGISCALSLQADGHSVTVLDPGPIGEGASWASCGCIAVGEIVPLSQPGMLMKVPGWLIDPETPLSLRPNSALRMLPWFARFAANARPRKMNAIAADLATLTFGATEEFKCQLVRHSISDMLVERPILKVFDDASDKATMGAAFDLARSLGCTIDEISGADAHDMEPAIASDFHSAAVLRDWSFITDPKRLVIDLHRAFTQNGGAVLPTPAKSLVRDGQRITGVICGDGQTITADEVILAAGTCSRDLARSIGLRLQIEGVIGYSTGLSDPGVALKNTVFYPKGGFGITPYENELSIAGTVEFAGLDAGPRWRRAEILVKRAHRVLPGLRETPANRRMGRRPLTSDTRPVLGRSKQIANLTFATGHGQLGVTLAAKTGRLVADLVAGRQPNSDLSPFSPDRFS